MKIKGRQDNNNPHIEKLFCFSEVHSLTFRTFHLRIVVFFENNLFIFLTSTFIQRICSVNSMQFVILPYFGSKKLHNFES